MFAFTTQWLHHSLRLTAFLIAIAVCGLLGSSVALGQAQANAADVQGYVKRRPGRNSYRRHRDGS